MKHALAAALALVLVSACATPPPPPPPPPPVLAPPAPPPAMEGMGEWAPANAAAELAGPESYLGPTPTAVVLLEPGQNARNRAFCEGYVSLPTTAELAAESAYASAHVATRWLLTQAGATSEQAKDCDFLLQSYDYNRGATLKNALSQDPAVAAQLTGAGPFIVQFLPEGGAVVVNGSSVPVGSLNRLSDAWLVAASMQAQSASAPRSPSTPATQCSPMTMSVAELRAARCTPEGILAGTIMDVLSERLPEVQVVVAGGRVLACWLANRCGGAPSA